MENQFIVITTINKITKGMDKFARMSDFKLIIVGDTKTPVYPASDTYTFLSYQKQQELPFSLAGLLPENHYCRKNLGYLSAMHSGANVISESDDDNHPYSSWSFPERMCGKRCMDGMRFVNVYRYYTDRLIWPRGYPLDEIKDSVDIEVIETEPVPVGVWPGMADNSPDVNAVFRLLFSEDIIFKHKPPFFLPAGCYTPFNSQNTYWYSGAFPYMYLPVTVSFRYMDILRGYVAQRCLREHGLYLGMTGATVYQNRNVHDLMKDFQQEIPCHLEVKQVVKVMEGLSLCNDPSENLIKLYSELADSGLVEEREPEFVRAWCNDYNSHCTMINRLSNEDAVT
jgi:hypothetical protein